VRSRSDTFPRNFAFLGPPLGTAPLFPGAGLDAGSAFRASIDAPSSKKRELCNRLAGRKEKRSHDFGEESLADPDPGGNQPASLVIRRNDPILARCQLAIS
jgi:hypothetical protein